MNCYAGVMMGASQVSIVLNTTESYMVQRESWTMVTKFTNNLFEYFLLSLFKLDLKCGLPRRKAI